MIKRPKPRSEEIVLDPKRYIVSKTDEKGIIEYGNDYFVEISGYKESELINQPHNIIRHPDMPAVLFDILWRKLKKGKSMTLYVKNMAKDGRYYWLLAEIEPKIDNVTNEITGYTAYRKATSKKAVEKIEPLYRKLKEIEDETDIESAEKYFRAYLEDKDMTYKQFVKSIIEDKGAFKSFFKKMKKKFR